MDALRRWIVLKLNEQNLSDREASIAAGMSEGYLSQLISGKTTKGRPARLGKKGAKGLAKVFGVDPGFLFDLEGKQDLPEGAAIQAAMRDERFQKIAGDWHSLTDDQKNSLQLFAEVLAEQNRGAGSSGR